MTPESAAFLVGKAVAQHAGRLWLAGRAAEAERSKDLVELMKFRFPDQIARRRVDRQLADIADSVTERLLPFCRNELRGLSDSDKTAALTEAKHTLEQADLSDRALFAADMDRVKLSRQIRVTLPTRGLERELGEAGARLYNVVLDECCDCLVRIVLQLPQFGPRASAEMLVRLSGVAEQIGLVLNRLPIRSLYAPDGSENDEEFTLLYLETVSHSLDVLELFGLRLERFQRPRIPLSVAYISLTATEQTTRRQKDPQLEVSIEDWHRDTPTGGARQVEQLLAESRLLLLRGEAGAGKSTLLRWIAINAARGKFLGAMAEWNGCVPFLIKLRSYADRELPPPEHFLDGVADQLIGLMPRGWVHRHLTSGRALILVDGIDELAGMQRQAVRDWLSGIVISFPAVRLVVTSRPAAAGADWLKAEGFTSASLERMSPAGITALIEHWHTAVRHCDDLPCPPERLPAYEAALLARLEAASNLRMLATNPLLAAMLCAINLDRDSQLPRDRMGLYGATLEMLLEARDARRNIPSARTILLEPDQKVRILQDLAWQLSTSNRVEFPKATAQRLIAEKLLSMPRIAAQAEEVLEFLLQRSGVLREPVPGRIDFVHRTVQEFLAAKQAADIGDMDLLIRNAHRDQWRETVIMAAGHANEPLRHELLSGILARIRTEPRKARRLKLLVVACLETLPAVPRDLRDDIDRCLDDLLPPADLTSARLLATAGEPVLAGLPESLAGLSEPVAKATIRTAWLINGPEALEVLSRYSGDERWAVQGELSEAWQYFDPDEYAERVLSRVLKIGRRVTVRDSAARLAALRKIPEVSYLDIWLDRLPNLDFLTPYSDSLRSLTLTVSEVLDLARLCRLNRLQSLALQDMELTDIGFLAAMRPLSGIWFTSCDGIRDYSPLSEHHSLDYLVLFESRQLTDIEMLPSLHATRQLGLSKSNLSCGLGDLVSQAPRLVYLYLNQCDWVDDLSSLAKLKLEDLRLWGCRSVNDVSPLASLDRLITLDLAQCSMHDLAPLAGLKALRFLRLSDCIDVNDLSPLASLSSLRDLYIDGISPGVDLGPLANNSRLNVTIDSGQSVRNVEALARRPDVIHRNVY